MDGQSNERGVNVLDLVSQPSDCTGEGSGERYPNLIAADALPERAFADLFAYWHARRSRRRAPQRSAVDPVALPRRLLPHLSIVERTNTGAGPRFRYRLVGSAVERAAGRSMTWEYLDEILATHNGCGDHLLALFRRTTDHLIPLYAEGAFLTCRNGVTGVRTSCHLLLPLLDQRDQPRYALTALTFGLQRGVEHAPFLDADDFRPGRQALVVAS